MLREIADATDDASNRKRGRELWHIGEDLMNLKEYSEAALRYSQAQPFLWESGLEFDLELAVHTCGRRAVALSILARHQEALDVMEDLMGRVALDWVPSDAEPGTRSEDQMPIAIGLWIDAFKTLGRPVDAISACDTLISAYDPAETEVRRLLVEKAFRMKGMIAEERGEIEAAIGFYEEAIKRSAGDEHKAPRSIFATSMAKRAGLLERTGHTQEALAAYEEIIATSSNPRRRRTQGARSCAGGKKKALPRRMEPDVQTIAVTLPP
jgi:tetratricopeptide (TPR) repeat protein